MVQGRFELAFSFITENPVLDNSVAMNTMQASNRLQKALKQGGGSSFGVWLVSSPRFWLGAVGLSDGRCLPVAT